MKVHFNRPMQLYYGTVLVLVLCALGYGLYFFWHKGPTNVENINSVFEANLLIDEMKKRDEVGRLRDLITNDRVREAVRLVDGLDREIKTLNQTAAVPNYSVMSADLAQARESLGALLSFPELSTVMLVFSNKINNFESYVSSNNWMTLTRTSRRIQSRVTPERLRSSDFYTLRRLNELSRSFEADFEQMKNVTTNSILSNENKNNILNNLQTFESELQMLRNYTSQLGVFKEHLSQFENSYAAWFSQVEPAIALRRIEFERSSQAVLFSFIALMGFVITTLLGGFILGGVIKRNHHKRVEQFIVGTIRDGLLPIDSKLEFSPSKEFDLELSKYREYIHKRMSFGTIFQEAMPFSSILLDSNLNVVWANSLFYEHWQMAENQVEDGSTTWDYLQQFTNLGEDDPVLQALRYNIAGIYHIQVRRNQEKQALPFEMYVSPVEYAGQKRIMIIFYPLSSVEQTLSDQTKSLVGPVVRSLDALTQGEWNSEFQHRIEKDFDIAGIKNVYEKFVEHFSVFTKEKDSLLLEIEELVNSLSRQKELIASIQGELNDQKKINHETVREFNKVKEDIISIVELRGLIEERYQSTSQASKALMKDEFELLSKAKEVNRLLTENVNAFDTVCKVRDEFKDLRKQVDHYRTEIMQLLDQTMLFVRNEGVEGRIDESLGRIKGEMRNFDRLLDSFGKVSTQLDVGLSKVSLILDRNEAPDIGHIEKKFTDSRELIENDMFDVSRMIADGEFQDQRMIDSLKELYGQFRLAIRKLDELDHFIAEAKSGKARREEVPRQLEEVS